FVGSLTRCRPRAGKTEPRTPQPIAGQGVVRGHRGSYGREVTEFPTNEGTHRETTGTDQPHRPARQRWGSVTPRSFGSGKRPPRVSDGDRARAGVPDRRRSAAAEHRHPARTAGGRRGRSSDRRIRLFRPGDLAPDLVDTGVAAHLRAHRPTV